MRRSFWLLTITIALVLFFVLSTWSFDFPLSQVREDALVINDLGRIRGGIQRWSKLVLAGENADSVAQEISTLIAKYSGSSVQIMPQLEANWELLQRLAVAYEIQPNTSTSEQILMVSEHCWELANTVVDETQFNSESEMHRFKYFRISFGLGIGIVAFLAFYVKAYVRDQLEIESQRDPLTGAYNRRYFEEYGAKEIARSKGEQRPLAVIMYDLDHFKRVNDTYGHAVGDQVLDKLTQVIGARIRKTDVLARIGGEEFAVLLPDTSGEGAQMVAEKLRAAVEKTDFTPVKSLTISIGLTELVPGDSLPSLLARADTALYVAKAEGRNRVRQL